MTIIGYGQFEYTVKSSTATVRWPVLGLALQKNHISFYNCQRRRRAGHLPLLGPARTGVR